MAAVANIAQKASPGDTEWWWWMCTSRGHDGSHDPGLSLAMWCLECALLQELVSQQQSHDVLLMGARPQPPSVVDGFVHCTMYMHTTQNQELVHLEISRCNRALLNFVGP